MEKKCSICKQNVDSEQASILVMGGYGNPRYICSDCENHLDVMTCGRDCDEIKNSMQQLVERMSSSTVEDELVFETMESIFAKAKERAEQIAKNEYDFSVDEIDSELEEIPEELKETEEDRQLDADETAEIEEKIRKFDKFVFYPLLGVVFAGFLAYLIFARFL